MNRAGLDTDIDKCTCGKEDDINIIIMDFLVNWRLSDYKSVFCVSGSD